MRMHVPTATPLAEQMLSLKRKRAAQEELEGSSASLVSTSLCELARDEKHRTKFRAELQRSTAVPALIKDHLAWATDLPASLQLVTLLAEKYLCTRLA